jgi:hypothetical protein
MPAETLVAIACDHVSSERTPRKLNRRGLEVLLIGRQFGPECHGGSSFPGSRPPASERATGHPRAIGRRSGVCRPELSGKEFAI